MLTLKQIYDDKARVVAGLEKKHFAGAAEAIDEVLRLDGERKAAQQEKDAAAAEMNKISKSIGMLMAQGKREEAEAAKAQTGALKAQIAEYDAKMSEAEEASPTFVSDRLVSLSVKLSSAFTLYEWFPTILREPLNTSVTFWEVTAPVKLSI